MRKGALAPIAIMVLIVGLIAIAIRREEGDSPAGGGSRLSVTASFYPLYYFATRVGGENAAVSDITPPGAEPHDYEPTPRDIVQMSSSALLILNGAGLEAWGDKIRSDINPGRTRLVVAAEGLATRTLVENGETTTDPHVWLSPPLAAKMVGAIAAGFESADPAHAAGYHARADSLEADLAALDRDYRAGLHTCGVRDFVTSHAAFGYLAEAYDLHQVAIAGLSPDAEPSPKTLADLAGFVRTKGLRYIFFETLVSPRFARALAAETGAKTLVLDPLEGLLPEEAAGGENYISIMRRNLANLRIALQCP